MARKHYIVIPNIADFNFGRKNYSKLIQVAIQNGASGVSATRDRLTNNVIVTFTSTKAEAVVIETALNALDN